MKPGLLFQRDLFLCARLFIKKTRLTHLLIYFSLDTLMSVIVIIMVLGTIILIEAVLVVGEIAVKFARSINLSIVDEFIVVGSKCKMFHNTQMMQ